MKQIDRLNYIRDSYKVPAAIGGRVRYSYPTPPRNGTITGTRGQYLMILLDGDTRPMVFHPTWKIEYLEETE